MAIQSFEKTGVATPSTEYKSISPMWDLIGHVQGGTKVMREQHNVYLMQHDKESNKRYRERWGTAVFINYFVMTIDFLVGKPFSRPVTLPETNDQLIKNIEFDFDNAGGSITSVLKRCFDTIMAKGRAYAFIDFPERPDGTITTLADVNAGVQPYWVNLDPEDVLCCLTERINGVNTITHFRYRTRKKVLSDTYEESWHYEIREFNVIGPGMVTMHVFSGDKYRDEKQVAFSLPFIPAKEFKANDNGTPPLLDLAYLNIDHFQSESDQRQALSAARYPMLGGKGVDEDAVPTVGPFTTLLSADPQSEYYYVENSGRALTVAREDIKEKEDKMALYGADFLKKRPDRETATSRLLDSSQATSPLQRIAHEFKSGVEHAMTYMAAWLELKDVKPTIDINLDFSLSSETNTKIENLKELYIQKAISRVVFLTQLKALSAIPADFDIAENEKELTREADSAMDRVIKQTQATQPKVQDDPKQPSDNSAN